MTTPKNRLNYLFGPTPVAENPLPRVRLLCVLLVLAGTALGLAQDRLKFMPGYERYEEMARQSANAVQFGALTVTWKENGKTFEYRKNGKVYRYDVATRGCQELPAASGNHPRNQLRLDATRQMLMMMGMRWGMVTWRNFCVSPAPSMVAAS